MIPLRPKWPIIVLGALLFSASVPAFAHHSFAMFDFSKNVTIKGTVKEFQWTNPHVILWVYADLEANENPQLWTIELTSPGNLTRTGWNRHSLKTGDHVELEISPLRDGTRGGAFKAAKLTESGQTLISNLRAQEKPGLE
jgi:hypothetical protein